MIPASKKSRSRKYLVKQLDDLARIRCFERDGYKCVRCGKGEGIQWCHVVTRSRIALRWDLDNNLTLDGGCHAFWWHKEPMEAMRWFEGTFPERYQHLLISGRIKIKVDLKHLLEGMKLG